MSLIDEYEFKKCVDRYKGDRHAIKFNCRDQFMVMSFAQFTDRSGLRDIETTLNLCGDLYRSGIKVMPKSTLAEANEKKDWRIYQDFAMTLVKEATALYKDEKLRIGLEEMIYAFDSSTIELCLKLCPWAEFHHGKGAFKMHTLMDLSGSIATFVLLTPGKVNDAKVMDKIPVERGSFYLMDKGYVAFEKFTSTSTRKAHSLLPAQRTTWSTMSLSPCQWTKTPEFSPMRPYALLVTTLSKNILIRSDLLCMKTLKLARSITS